MKTILKKPHGRLHSCSYAASTTLFTLALALLLWGCTKEEEELAPLRESIKTVINTRPPAFVATDSVKLSAEVLEIGQAPILEAGFVLSETAEPNLDRGTLYKLSDVKATGPYSLVVKKLQANKKYYYRFYVKEQEQVLYGGTREFMTGGVTISRVRYMNASDPEDFYEGSPGNNMMIEGKNFSMTASENLVKVGSIAAPVSSVHIYNEQEGSAVLYFNIPEGVSPGLHEVTITRAGQTVKAPEMLQVLPGSWRKLNDLKTGFQGNGVQYNASAFAVNNNGYMAGMLPYLPISLYQYSPGADDWEKLSISIDSYNPFHAAFGLGDKAYISAGVRKYNTAPNVTRYEIQLHSLNPATGVQEQKQPVPMYYPYSNSNVSLTAFTVGEHAYLGGGNYTIGGYSDRAYRKDFYKYSPTSDTWTQIADFPGTSTTDAVTFEVDGIAYLVAPSYDYIVLPEVWAYNSKTNTWSRKRDFPGQIKYGMAAFAIGSAGYLVGGATGTSSYAAPGLRDFWKYDPQTDTWQEVANFDNSNKGIKCFVIGGKAYVVLHQSQNSSSVWEFTPAL